MISKRNKLVVLACIVISFGILATLTPFLWAILTSLRSDMDLLRGNPYIPSSITFENYHHLFRTFFLTWLTNSSLVSLSVSFIAVSTAVPISFFLTHRTFLNPKVILPVFVSGFIAPSGLLFLPLSRNALIASTPELVGLSLVYLSFLIPQATWLLSSYFVSVSPNLERASKIEGISTLQFVVRVLVPTSWSGIAFTWFYCMIISWGEYTYALVLTSNTLTWTLPIGLSSLETGDIIPWGKIMAGITISIVPLLLLFSAVWNQFERKSHVMKYAA